MKLDTLRTRLEAALAACAAKGGRCEPLEIGDPADEEELRTVEVQLGRALPRSLRKALALSREVRMRWFLPEELSPPAPLQEIFSGDCFFSLRELTALEESRQGWVRASFPDEADPYDRVWHEKLPFAAVPNGDLLAIDLRAGDDGPVVYLSHDDGAGHGRVFGASFEDFLERATLLGCPGNEDFQMMPFLGEGGLEPWGENAGRWRRWFGLRADDLWAT